MITLMNTNEKLKCFKIFTLFSYIIFILHKGGKNKVQINFFFLNIFQAILEIENY